MKVKPGFKHTDVGLIPEDWRVSTLGEMCAFENGDRGKNYPSGASYAPDGVPFINAGHVAEGRIRLSDLNYISKESFDLLGSGKFKPGDILFCLRGSLGKFGVVGPDLGEGAIASSLIIVRSKSANVGREYLSCYFRSAYCAQMIKKWSGGAAQPNLGAQDLARFTIPLPPTKAEQEAIAEALCDADALIESLEQLVAKKRQIKQGAMQELLAGKKRLPGFDGEWQTYRQSEVVTFINGRAYGRHEWETSGTPVCRLQNLTGSGDTFYYSNLKLPEKQYMENGDLIFMWSASFGPYIWRGPRAIFHYHIWKIECDDQLVDLSFYYYKLVEITEYLKSTTDGSTMLHLTKTGMEQFKVTLPTVEEQTAIAAVLSDMDAEIAALEAKLTKARQLKQGMMQELLTGRVRLV